jgi:hypothetical protein
VALVFSLPPAVVAHYCEDLPTTGDTVNIFNKPVELRIELSLNLCDVDTISFSHRLGPIESFATTSAAQTKDSQN